jgi:hypothetical protein
VKRAGCSSGLRLYLLGGIVLKADSRGEVQLRLQLLEVFFALDDRVLEELPRAGIALIEAERDPLLERRQGPCFQLQIPLKHVFEVVTDMHIEGLVQVRHALQEEDAVDQALRVAHFLERFLIDLFIQPTFKESG